MGSASVCVKDDFLHVAVDGYGHWWAVGKEGSYGGSTERPVAVSIAIDASRTATGGQRRIVVHSPNGAVEFEIVRCRGKATPQFFQDNVP